MSRQNLEEGALRVADTCYVEAISKAELEEFRTVALGERPSAGELIGKANNGRSLSRRLGSFCRALRSGEVSSADEARRRVDKNLRPALEKYLDELIETASAKIRDFVKRRLEKVRQAIQDQRLTPLQEDMWKEQAAIKERRTKLKNLSRLRNRLLPLLADCKDEEQTGAIT